ncbi:hypothetical protein Droror1_Dr00013406 [Drosera rotundifolia]
MSSFNICKGQVPADAYSNESVLHDREDKSHGLRGITQRWEVRSQNADQQKWHGDEGSLGVSSTSSSASRNPHRMGKSLFHGRQCITLLKDSENASLAGSKGSQGDGSFECSDDAGSFGRHGVSFMKKLSNPVNENQVLAGVGFGNAIDTSSEKGDVNESSSSMHATYHYDIYPPKTGTTFTLKPSLLEKNSEIRNIVKRSMEGPKEKVLDLEWFWTLRSFGYFEEKTKKSSPRRWLLLGKHSSSAARSSAKGRRSSPRRTPLLDKHSSSAAHNSAKERRSSPRRRLLGERFLGGQQLGEGEKELSSVAAPRRMVRARHVGGGVVAGKGEDCQNMSYAWYGHGGFYRPGYRDGAKLNLHMMCLGKNWDPDEGIYGSIRSNDGTNPPAIPQDFIQLVKKAMKSSHEVICEESGVRNALNILPNVSPDICFSELLFNKRETRPASAEFLYGDQRDIEKAEKVVLECGDVLIFGGRSRHVFHGVTVVIPDSAPKMLVDETNLRPGRFNLTFRQY